MTAGEFGARVAAPVNVVGRTPMLRVVAAVLGLLGLPISLAAAEEVSRGSECLAMAQSPPRATPVSLRLTAAKADEVTITYAGQSNTEIA